MGRPQDIRGASSETGPSLGATLRKLLLYSLFLFTIPIFLYFFLKYTVLEGTFEVNEHKASMWAAFGAVAAVHVILGLFIYSAFNEEERTTPVKTD